MLLKKNQGRLPHVDSRKPVILKPYGSSEWEKEVFAKIAEVRDDKCSTEEELVKAVKNVDILMADVDITVTGRVIRNANKLKAIVCRSIGVDYVDIGEATRKGIYVTNQPDFCVNAVAEYTLIMILVLLRKVPLAAKKAREGGWRIRESLTGYEFKGKSLGIVGLGRIGKLVAEKAKVLGAKVMSYDPHVSKKAGEKLGVKMVGLDVVLKHSDLVSIHTPLTDETRGLIGETELRKMKKTAYLVNVSRGAIVDETALYRALKSKRIAGAAVDVLEKEPPNAHNPLMKLENIIVTPHIGWNTMEAKKTIEEGVRKEAMRIIKGEVPSNLVNKDVLRRPKLES